MKEGGRGKGHYLFRFINSWSFLYHCSYRNLSSLTCTHIAPSPAPTLPPHLHPHCPLTCTHIAPSPAPSLPPHLHPHCPLTCTHIAPSPAPTLPPHLHPHCPLTCTHIAPSPAPTLPPHLHPHCPLTSTHIAPSPCHILCTIPSLLTQALMSNVLGMLCIHHKTKFFFCVPPFQHSSEV